MEPERSLPCSQRSATGLYPERQPTRGGPPSWCLDEGLTVKRNSVLLNVAQGLESHSADPKIIALVFCYIFTTLKNDSHKMCGY